MIELLKVVRKIYGAKRVNNTVFKTISKNNLLKIYQKKYPWIENFDELLFLLKNKKTFIKPICKFNNCYKKREFKKKINNYSVGCCRNHTTKLTCIDKYGVDNPMKSKKIIKKAQNTNIKKYGHKSPLQNKSILTKMQNNIFEKYGVTNIAQESTTKDKIRKTNLKKFGSEYYFSSEQGKNDVKSIMINKYGSHNPSLIDNFKEKRKNTCLEKYGVENGGVISQFKRKKYIWGCGEISWVQGYEPIILKELEEQGYTFNDILTDPQDMPEIIYIFNNIKHRYYPDVYIPKENKIIEVKSEYTLNKEWDKNQAKFKATKELGYDFKLEVRN